MKKIIIIFVVGLLMQQMIRAQGTITYLSNLGQSPVGSEPVASDSWLAIEFGTGNNPSGYLLDSIELGLANDTGSPNAFTAMIYNLTNAMVAGLPGSSLGTLDGSANPSASCIYSYSDNANIILLPNTSYFIVTTAGTTAVTGAYGWSYANTFSYNEVDGWAVGNNEDRIATFLSSLNGLSWSSSNGNLQFAISATPIPEPSVLGLLGLGSLFLVRRCRALKN